MMTRDEYKKILESMYKLNTSALFDAAINEQIRTMKLVHPHDPELANLIAEHIISADRIVGYLVSKFEN